MVNTMTASICLSMLSRIVCQCCCGPMSLYPIVSVDGNNDNNKTATVIMSQATKCPLVVPCRSVEGQLVSAACCHHCCPTAAVADPTALLVQNATAEDLCFLDLCTSQHEASLFEAACFAWSIYQKLKVQIWPGFTF